MRLDVDETAIADILGSGQRFLADITTAVYLDAKRFVPVDTSALQQSIDMVVRRKYGIVSVGTDYWEWQEYGAGPHIIRPRTKQALAWPGMVGGPYAKVNHPGNAAQPFMRPALYKNR